MGRGGDGKTRALGDDSHLMALRSHVEKRTLYREKGGAAAPTAEVLGSLQPAASYAAPQVVLLLKIPRKKIVKGNGSKILASQSSTPSPVNQ